MYRLLSVDPGPVKSGAVISNVVDAADLRLRGEWSHPFGVEPEWAKHLENGDLLDMTVALVFVNSPDPLRAVAAERIASAYEGSGRDLFDTQLVAGALVDGIARAAMCRNGFHSALYVFKSQAESCLGQFTYGGVRGDAEVKKSLVAMYGGKERAVGGLVCKTCRKPEGWVGRAHDPCPNCNANGGGHGALGLESPPGPLAILGNNQHLWDALAVGVTAAMIIGSKNRKKVVK